jgi:hypothetical protein
MTTPTTISIDGTDYVRADSQTAPTHEDYVIVRSDRAGVFAGHLVEHDRSTGHVVMTDVRRLWKWIGASISEVAEKGAIEPANVKYSVPVRKQIIATVIEVIPTTEAAMTSIKAVASWTR